MAAFVLVQFVDGSAGLLLLYLIASFLCLATMNVNYALFIGMFTVATSVGWVEQGFDTALFNASNRIEAEAVAIVMAIATAGLLQWWSTRRGVSETVEATLAN